MPIFRRCPCGASVPHGQRCACKRQRQQASDRDRGTATQRGYGKDWRRARAAWLAEHPLCADPFGAHGARFAAASVVDHIVPHKGDPELFWSAANYQSLCASCHSRKTAMEDGGFGNRLR